MGFPTLAPVACLATCLFLAACGSSDSPSTSPTTEADDDPAYPAPNGTLTVNGNPLPANISGIFDDTSMTLTFNTFRKSKDTGWVLLLASKPAVGTHPYVEILFGAVGSHYTAAPDTCTYTARSASTTLTAWSTQPSGSYRKGMMSGSASLDLTRWRYETGDCPDATVSVTFTGAEALDGNRIGDILE